MNPSFGGVPAFGVRPRPPLTSCHKEALSRWSSKSSSPSSWMKAHAEEAKGVTVLGPREAKEVDGGVAEDRGAKGGTASAAGVEGTSRGRSGEVLVRLTAKHKKKQPEVGGKLVSDSMNRCHHSQRFKYLA